MMTEIMVKSGMVNPPVRMMVTHANRAAIRQVLLNSPIAPTRDSPKVRKHRAAGMYQASQNHHSSRVYIRPQMRAREPAMIMMMPAAMALVRLPEIMGGYIPGPGK